MSTWRHVYQGSAMKKNEEEYVITITVHINPTTKRGRAIELCLSFSSFSVSLPFMYDFRSLMFFFVLLARE